MGSLIVPRDVEWELLVVNNGCTDETDDVIARHAGKLPLRRLFEPRPGACHARNCAIEAATGDLIVLTDDDVLVEPSWLAEYVSAARAWPSATFFNGPVEPYFAAPPPAWVTRHLARLTYPLVIMNEGRPTGPLPLTASVVSANMAVRSRVLKSNLFDPNLGRLKLEVTGHEDSELVERLRSQGHECVWVSTALLRHNIPAERMTTHYLWRWYHGEGRIQVRRKGVPPCPQLFGAPRYLFRACWVAYAKSLLFSLSKGDRWIRYFCAAAKYRGMIAEARAASRPRP
jgi:glycosyltransferase involved in cell wall biosynthesis